MGLHRNNSFHATLFGITLTGVGGVHDIWMASLIPFNRQRQSNVLPQSCTPSWLLKSVRHWEATIHDSWNLPPCPTVPGEACTQHQEDGSALWNKVGHDVAPIWNKNKVISKWELIGIARKSTQVWDSRDETYHVYTQNYSNKLVCIHSSILSGAHASGTSGKCHTHISLCLT